MLDYIKKYFILNHIRRFTDYKKAILFLFFIFSSSFLHAQKNTVSLQLIYEVNNPENYYFKKDIFSFKDTVEIQQKLNE